MGEQSRFCEKPMLPKPAYRLNAIPMALFMEIESNTPKACKDPQKTSVGKKF